MKIKINYWPSTPHLREIKVYVNDNLELSSFSNLQEIEAMINELKKACEELKVIE